MFVVLGNGGIGSVGSVGSVDDDIAGWLVSLCTCELGQPGGGREFSVLVTTSL